MEYLGGKEIVSPIDSEGNRRSPFDKIVLRFPERRPRTFLAAYLRKFNFHLVHFNLTRGRGRTVKYFSIQFRGVFVEVLKT